MILRTEIQLCLGMVTFERTVNTSLKIVLPGLEIECKRDHVYI